MITCKKCGLEQISNFPPPEFFQGAHLVPCFCFEGKKRKERKQKADRYGKRMLCTKCHDILEKMVGAFIWRFIPKTYSNPC